MRANQPSTRPIHHQGFERLGNLLQFLGHLPADVRTAVPFIGLDTSHNRLSSIDEGIEFRLGADMKVAEALEEG